MDFKCLWGGMGVHGQPWGPRRPRQRAAAWRDRLVALRRTIEGQGVRPRDKVDRDFVAFARATGAGDGHVMAVFVMAVAAAEAAIGLALVILLYRNRITLNIDDLNLHKG